MSSEIEGLDDLHTFVKLGNYVSRFSFPHMNMPIIAPAMMPRFVQEKELWFDPLTAKAEEPDEETEEAAETEAPAPKPPTPSTDVKVQAIKPRKDRAVKPQRNEQQITAGLAVVPKNNGIIRDQSQLL